MEEAKFYSIIENMTKLLTECNSLCVHDKSELDNLTLKEVMTRVNSARSLYSKMDKILTSELYHIIGMGDLTEEQSKLFISKIKILCKFRPYLKPLSCSNITIPQIPEDTEYKCNVLKIKLNDNLEVMNNG